jgi:hypothetical protein
MNIEESIRFVKELLENDYLEDVGYLREDEDYKFFNKAIETLLTAYEKEKEKNKELSNSYDKLAKECNEENRRCMLLAVENQDLKEKNKELNILRLELLISQFPDTTETYKKYKKELEELLKEE